MSLVLKFILGGLVGLAVFAVLFAYMLWPMFAFTPDHWSVWAWWLVNLFGVFGLLAIIGNNGCSNG